MEEWMEMDWTMFPHAKGQNKHNNLKFCSRISKYFYKPESESLWYTNYLLSEWLEHCILNNFKVLK